MKFMKIGTRPDTFYTEEAVRTLISDIPSDLSIRINNISYLLHKFALLPRCGLLQRLCSDASAGDNDNNGDDDITSAAAVAAVELHDIPGGEEAFELCAKFCYGITINLSAHNFVGAFCAAKFLRMTEAVEKGNFVLKLEAFFNSCILEGWKDSIVALQSTVKLAEWSENLGIIRKCIDSIVEKILTPPAKVTWSYTYTRPGYNKKHHSVPKDWWTEDISDLDTDMFRCIVTALRTLDILPPQLIGEALHVYASRWLPDATKPRNSHHSSSTTQSPSEIRKTLEAVVGMIPADRRAVSAGFLLRLVAAASSSIGVSPATKTELLRKCGAQLEDATVDDLLFPAQPPNGGGHFYDIDLVLAVVESFMVLCRRQAMPSSSESGQVLRALRKVGKLVDCYLQVVARDVNMPVLKVVALAEAVPDAARESHDDIYKAINFFLKDHPDLNKAEKKRLCRILDCQKLSPEVRSHAVNNERLPLRTVVQLLYFDQERGNSAATTAATTTTNNAINNHMSKLSLQADLTPRSAKHTPTASRSNYDHAGKLKLATASDDKSTAAASDRRAAKQLLSRAESERKTGKAEIEEVESAVSVSKLDVRKMTRKGSHKGRDR